MGRKQQRELDSLLEGMLHDGAMRPVPVGLHRRVESRVRFVAMQDRERRRFRSVVLGGLSGLAGTIVLAALGAWYLGLPDQFAQQAPGFRGRLDQLAVGLAGPDRMWVVGAVCVALVLLVGALLLERLGSTGRRRDRHP